MTQFNPPRYPIEDVCYPDPAHIARHAASGGWLPLAAGELLREAARVLPDKAAIVSDEGRLSYREFDAQSERLGAALLERGLHPGDRVLFQMGTVIETAIALLACFKAGLVPVCSLPQYREIEMEALANLSGASAWLVQGDAGSFDLVAFAARMTLRCPAVRTIIVARGTRSGTGEARADVQISDFADLIQTMPLATAREALATVTPQPRDVLAFQLSGGTTGVPKIIPRFHGEYIGQARAWAERTGMDESLVALYALPLIHNAGQIATLFPALILRGTMVLMARMDARTWFEWIERERVTHSLSIGPIAVQAIDYPGVVDHDCSSLRLLMSFNRADLLEAHMKVPCTNIFGITEGVLMSSAPSDATAARWHTVGYPVCASDEVCVLVPGSEERVPAGETGELCIRGPSVTSGYFRMPAINATAFTRDGFFRTGDLVRQHSIDGRLVVSFEGRIKDNIDRGGEKFGAEAVEELISRHPAIADARVVAMPDRVYGERACAWLVVRPGHEAPSLASLGEFLTGLGLARFKLPERLEVITQFPVTRVGKVDKAALRAMIATRLEAEQAQAGRA
jgi:non-ribosomal peptide synthetase component E (peptide arylation enzyme)